MKTKHQRKKRKEQQQRRRTAHRVIDPQPFSYELIDGNWSRYIIGYCGYRSGWLTLGLANIHDCWSCKKFRAGVDEKETVLSS